MGFNKLSDNNIQLRKEKSELGAQLGARTAEKAALEKDLAKLKTDSNATEHELRQKNVSYRPSSEPPGTVAARKITEFRLSRRSARKRFYS